MKAKCPYCGVKLEIPGAYEDKAAKCPKCSRLFMVGLGSLRIKIVRWTLIIGLPFVTVKLLWPVHWVLGLVLALLVFVIIIFLTRPLYLLHLKIDALIARRVFDLKEKGSDPKQEADTR